MGAAFLAIPAYAENALVEVNDSTMVPMLKLTADAVEDMDVMGQRGVKIGEIVGNDANTPSALVVNFDDRSNYADRNIAIPLDQFTYPNGVLTLRAKPSDLSAYAEYKD